MAFRNAVLGLAVDHPFARRLVNAGRLSLPCSQEASSLTSADVDLFDVPMRSGIACLDAPVMSAAGRDWLLRQLGDGFTLLLIGNALPQADREFSDDRVGGLAQAGLRIARARSRPAMAGVSTSSALTSMLLPVGKTPTWSRSVPH